MTHQPEKRGREAEFDKLLHLGGSVPGYWVQLYPGKASGFSRNLEFLKNAMFPKRPKEEMLLKRPLSVLVWKNFGNQHEVVIVGAAARQEDFM